MVPASGGAISLTFKFIHLGLMIHCSHLDSNYMAYGIFREFIAKEGLQETVLSLVLQLHSSRRSSTIIGRVLCVLLYEIWLLV